jgi:succinyl-diaminopimelate desuccinylase
MSFSKIAKKIDTYREDVIELETKITAIPALSPEYHAAAAETGEARKTEFLKKYLIEHGITDFEEINAPDERVPGGVRPNLIARIKGRSSDKTTWVMAHMDVVPPGDMDKWNTDPWKVTVDGDMLYGRGVEDNQQGLVSGVMVARALLETGTVPPYDLALLFVADEECGSEYGIQYVLKHSNPFKPEDIIVVPDGGAPDGSEIEVAEKGIIWAKFNIKGEQCHGSMPAHGINAMRAGAHLIVRLDNMLHEKFADRDPVFSPPECTFEPTKKENNVGAVNIIPGDDVFFLDCRILPSYSLDDVIDSINGICAEVEKEFGVKVNMSFEQKEEAAPSTPEEGAIVGLLRNAVKEVYGVDARPVGIGGGTVAAYLRREGLPCAVWSKMEETMHTPNESTDIKNILGDAKVIAHIVMAG